MDVITKHISIEKLYAIFLITLIGWAAFGYVTMSSLIKEQKIYGELINISGKQRMLSQRVVLYSKVVFQDGQTQYLPILTKSLKLMKYNHSYLIHHIPSDEIRKIYYHSPDQLNEDINDYFAHMEALIHSNSPADLKTIERSIHLLPHLEEIVNTLQKEYETKINDTIRTETLIFIGAFITLLFEAVFIIIPAIRQIKTSKEEAEKALNVKELFMSNMNHELRTPLNAIRGFIHLLKNRENTSSNEHYLNIIEASSDTLLKIVEDVMDHKHIQNGTFRIETHPFDPVSLISETIELYSPSAIEKNIRYLAYVDPTIPICLEGDPYRVKQIIGNLLSNAAKFTPDKGTILIKATYDRQTRLLRFAVKDTGIGIDSKTISSIFEPFTQGDLSITKEYSGIGMGLTVSMQLARMMHGTIRVDSVPQKGSTFVLELPLATCPQIPSATVPASGTFFIHTVSHFASYSQNAAQYLEALGLKPVAVESEASLEVYLTDGIDIPLPEIIAKPSLVLVCSAIEPTYDHPLVRIINLPFLPAKFAKVLETFRSDFSSSQ